MIKYFDPNDLIIVDPEAGMHFYKQAVYEYGDNYELSIITNDDITYEYELRYNTLPTKLRYFFKDGLSCDDVENLMSYVVKLTGHNPIQI